MIRLLKPERYRDSRGFFQEVYNLRKLEERGISAHFVQDNRSLSLAAGTLRGLHFQVPPHAQAKLVRCTKGSIFDVAVDIRRGSKTYGSWQAFELSAENSFQLFVPIGFAHGFMTLQDNTEVEYKCSDYYAPDSEGSIRWDSCEISWPTHDNVITSDKDAEALPLSKLIYPFIFGENS